MLRTLLITLDFPPRTGGIANYWANLGRHFDAGDFIVLAPEYDNSLEFDVNQKYLIYRKELVAPQAWFWPKWLPMIFEAAKIIRRDKIQKIIVTHVLPAGTAAYLLKMILHVPYIVSLHGLDVALSQSSWRKRWLTRQILNSAENIIANSDFTKKMILNLNLCAENKIIVVFPCPSVVGTKIPDNIKTRLIENYNLRDKKIILTVGRLIERKGQDKVIQSMSQILEREPNAIYVIVGNGDYLKYLQEQIVALKLEKNVFIFTDIADYELPVFYEMADVFAMPCRELENGDVEGFGIVYLEANFYGKPVVAGNSGGAVDAVENNVNGLVVDPLSLNEIGGAVIKLLSDKKYAIEMGERGRQRVLDKFNWGEQAKKIMEILD
ncbi:MAG: glycosyltransferase family 4 protein [Parcubacteria group bacterium]